MTNFQSVIRARTLGDSTDWRSLVQSRWESPQLVWHEAGKSLDSSDSLVARSANLPFGRLIDACLWLHEQLQPVFDATPHDPFPQLRKTGGGGKLTSDRGDQILQLAKAELRKEEIAEKLTDFLYGLQIVFSGGEACLSLRLPA